MLCMLLMGVSCHECWPADCVLTFHPDTDAPLHEVSTVPLVVSFQPPLWAERIWIMRVPANCLLRNCFGRTFNVIEECERNVLTGF